MFRSEGWKQLISDLRGNVEQINSVEFTEDGNNLYFRKGQLAILGTLFNLETQIDNFASSKNLKESLKMRLFDFRCPCGQKFEDLVKSDVTTSRCSCGLDAKRIVSPVRSKLEGIVETSLMHMTSGLKRRKQQIAHERKQYS